MSSDFQAVYNPKHDFSPNGRDFFAINERTGPVFNSEEDMAVFLGAPVEQIRKRGMRSFMPRAVAKWRYMCADAMIQERDGQ